MTAPAVISPDSNETIWKITFSQASTLRLSQRSQQQDVKICKAPSSFIHAGQPANIQHTHVQCLPHTIEISQSLSVSGPQLCYHERLWTSDQSTHQLVTARRRLHTDRKDESRTLCPTHELWCPAHYILQGLDQAATFRVSLDKHYCYPPVPGHLRVGGARRDAGERHWLLVVGGGVEGLLRHWQNRRNWNDTRHASLTLVSMSLSIQMLARVMFGSINQTPTLFEWCLDQSVCSDRVFLSHLFHCICDYKLTCLNACTWDIKRSVLFTFFVYEFVYDGRKFPRQCVSVIDTTWGCIYFLTCGNVRFRVCDIEKKWYLDIFVDFFDNDN